MLTLRMMIGRDARTRSLQHTATGLLLANLVVIGAAIASLLVARRAWDLREDALTALAAARAPARAGQAPPLHRAAQPGAPEGAPAQANVRAPIGKLRAATMDRILLWGSRGALGSAFFTWRLLARSRALVRSFGLVTRRRS